MAIFQADNIDYTIFSGREHGAALYNGLIGAPLEGLLHLASYQAAFETFHDLGETATFAEVSALQKSAASQINGSITFSVDSDLQNAANFAALGIDGVFLFKSLPSLGARSVSNLGDVGDYAGRFGDLRSAVAHLRDSGYTRLDRREFISSFERGTIKFDVATDDLFALRFFNEGASFEGGGKFLTPTLPASRNSLAILPEWNNMDQFGQFLIPKGTPIITGRVAPQGNLGGGGNQIFVSDPKVLKRVKSGI